LDEHTSVVAFFAERGFGRRIGFGSRPAVVVVDMINGFTNPSMPLGAPVDDQIEATKALIAAARDAAVPVIFTAVAFESDRIEDVGIWLLKQEGLRSLVAGTRAVDVDSRLERRPDEQILYKRHASAFYGTDLTERLAQLGVDTVLIAGCTTSGCVRATAVDACAAGLRSMIVREAVGDRAAEAHRQSLFDLDQKYADVVTLDDAVTYLRGQAFDPGVAG
jgi:nicotinamidase-related amidase